MAVEEDDPVRNFLVLVLLEQERESFTFGLIAVLVGYVGVSFWFRSEPSWILGTGMLILWGMFFQVAFRRLVEMGVRYAWLLAIPAVVSRINNWEIVILPVVAIGMLIASARTTHLSHRYDDLIIGMLDDFEEDKQYPRD
jgi:hypothetical protein